MSGRPLPVVCGSVTLYVTRLGACRLLESGKVAAWCFTDWCGLLAFLLRITELFFCRGLVCGLHSSSSRAWCQLSSRSAGKWPSGTPRNILGGTDLLAFAGSCAPSGTAMGGAEGSTGIQAGCQRASRRPQPVTVPCWPVCTRCAQGKSRCSPSLGAQRSKKQTCTRDLGLPQRNAWA